MIKVKLIPSKGTSFHRTEFLMRNNDHGLELGLSVWIEHE